MILSYVLILLYTLFSYLGITQLLCRPTMTEALMRRQGVQLAYSYLAAVNYVYVLF